MAKNNTDTTNYVKSLETMRQTNYERMHSAALRWNELANNRSSEISKLLFSIASLVLPISLYPLTQENFVLNGDLSKFFLVGAWISFVASLSSGFFYLKDESKFFNKWANQENERSLVYSEAILTPDPVKAFDRFEEMNKEAAQLAKEPSTTNSKFLNLQQLFLVIGMFLIGLTLSAKLFSTPEIENTVQKRNSEFHNDFYKQDFRHLQEKRLYYRYK